MKLDAGTLWRITLATLGFTLLSAVKSVDYDWPDYHHAEYGFPLPWLTRVLSTIRGATDYLVFETIGFTVDFIFWFLLTVGILFSLIVFRRVVKSILSPRAIHGQETNS